MMDEFREMVLEIPTRVELLGGQYYKYVRLEEILDLIEVFEQKEAEQNG